MRRIAVVGSGVSGLTAAWALRLGNEVTLYEADSRLGGHAHTHDFDGADGRAVSVDSGFIVHNERTYPTLLRLFSELGVQTQAAQMSMSVRCDGCGLEYAGARRSAGLFATPASAVNVRYLRMLAAVPRFHRAARRLLADGPDDSITLRSFLSRHRFTQFFIDHFAIPMVACVWSCPPGIALDYPAAYLFRFLDHHGMLGVFGSPEWRTVTGGSREYVRRVAADLPDIRTGVSVRRVSQHDDHMEVVTSGAAERYDAVVIATHPAQALALMESPTALQRDVLGTFTYSPNRAQIHSDLRMMPVSSRAHASWNYRTTSCGGRDGKPVVVTYDMNRLQQLPGPERYLVSLNATHMIAPESVRASVDYEHPQYTPSSVTAQRRLADLNDNRLAFAGAYHGWGFHEDGARSGVAAARALGASW